MLTGLINSLLPEPQAGLLNGILFGVKATLDPAIKNSLTNSGTLYIFAHSGLTISVLISMFNLVLPRFLRRPIANIVSLTIIIGYVWLVGVTPSVLRAAIMAGISLIAVSLGRQKWPILAWILAVISMLLLNPPWIADLSFQLSAMASLGIILFGSNKETNQKTFFSFVKDNLRISLAAQVLTVPIVMIQFHRISLVSPLSNILIGWLIAPIMALGFVMVIVGYIWLPLGMIAGWFVWVPLTYVIWVINWTSRLPFASISF